MGENSTLGWATRRFGKFSALILLLGLTYTVISTAGSVALTRLGSAYESYFYPALGPMRATVRDDDGQLVIKALPAFQIEEMRWMGDDLLLVRGTLCKQQPYQYVEVHWFYGTPDGLNIPATFVNQARIKAGGRGANGGNRGVGCQIWTEWLLEGARSVRAEHFYADITYRPPHNLWDVTYRLGPFRLPPRTIEGPIVPGENF